MSWLPRFSKPIVHTVVHARPGYCILKVQYGGGAPWTEEGVRTSALGSARHPQGSSSSRGESIVKKWTNFLATVSVAGALAVFPGVARADGVNQMGGVAALSGGPGPAVAGTLSITS